MADGREIHDPHLSNMKTSTSRRGTRLNKFKSFIAGNSINAHNAEEWILSLPRNELASDWCAGHRGLLTYTLVGALVEVA